MKSEKASLDTISVNGRYRAASQKFPSNRMLRQERPDLVSAPLLERGAVVAFLLRRQLRLCLRQHSQELYRAAEEAALMF